VRRAGDEGKLRQEIQKCKQNFFKSNCGVSAIPFAVVLLVISWLRYLGILGSEMQLAGAQRHVIGCVFVATCQVG
jgi:hypothetical protein